MNIILGKENLETIDKRYVVLELDTIRIKGSTDPVTAYCLIDELPLNEISVVAEYSELHNNLLRNYRKRNWNYCENAIEHLRGRWRGEVDSFYDSLTGRIQDLRTATLESDWTGVVDKT